jgi:hypothetical protein
LKATSIATAQDRSRNRTLSATRNQTSAILPTHSVGRLYLLLGQACVSASNNESEATNMRVSLRSFFIGTAIVAALLAVFAYLRQPDPALRRVQALGGDVDLEYNSTIASALGLRRLGHPDSIDIDSNQFRDDDLIALSQYSTINSIAVTSDGVTDKSVSRLKNVRGLVDFSISSSQVTDKGLLWCGRAEQLRDLTIDCPHVTGEFLSEPGFGSLLALTLISPAVDDSIARDLVKMIALVHLVIHLAPVTDETLAVVEELPRVELVAFEGTMVTADGAAALKSRRPELEVHYRP